MRHVFELRRENISRHDGCSIPYYMLLKKTSLRHVLHADCCMAFWDCLSNICSIVQPSYQRSGSQSTIRPGASRFVFDLERKCRAELTHRFAPEGPRSSQGAQRFFHRHRRWTLLGVRMTSARPRRVCSSFCVDALFGRRKDCSRAS